MVEQWQLSFAKAIRVKIVNRHINQKELAEYIGVSDSTISKYVKCTKKPSIDTIMRIADFFECTVDELLTYKH